MTKSPTCGSCGRGLSLSQVHVLVRSAGEYMVLGACCRSQYPGHKQYDPRTPSRAVERIQGGGGR